MSRSRGYGIYCRYYVKNTIIVVCTLLLSGCGQFSFLQPAKPNKDRLSPVSNTESLLKVPPGLRERPNQEASPAPSSLDSDQTLPGPAPGTVPEPQGTSPPSFMKPAMGVRDGALFAEPASNPDRRMERLESAVQQLRNDFDIISPTIMRLVSVEKDLQSLIKQIEVFLTPEPLAPVPVQTAAPSFTGPAPGEALARPSDSAPLSLQPDREPERKEDVQNKATAQSPANQAVAPTPQIPSGAPQVYNLRVGEHPDKTRIVLDVNEKVSFNTDLDNGEKILLVELPSTQWSTSPSKTYGKKSLLTSYKTSTVNQGSGSLLILELKSTASILNSSIIPGKEGKGKRIVIDIKEDGMDTN